MCVYVYVCVCSPSKLPQTQMEWAQLLEAQQRYHDAELQKWREIIKSSVVLLDQVLTHKEMFFKITSELLKNSQRVSLLCVGFRVHTACVTRNRTYYIYWTVMADTARYRRYFSTTAVAAVCHYV